MAHDPARPGFDTTAAAVEGAADGLADGIDREGLDHSLPRLAGETAPIASRGLRAGRLRASLEKADEKVSAAIAGTRTKARAVAESARRARRAPPHLLDDAKRAASAYVGGLAASAGFYAAAGLVAAIAFIVLTIGFVQGLNRLWGRPWGAFAVALGYGVLTLVLAGTARGRAEAGRREASDRIEDARQEVRGVTEPLRQAFGNSRPGAPTQVADAILADARPTSAPQTVRADIGADPHAPADHSPGHPADPLSRM